MSQLHFEACCFAASCPAFPRQRPPGLLRPLLGECCGFCRVDGSLGQHRHIMSLYNGPPRGGNRGGKDQFNWDNVKGDKDREFYLGHSVKATTGRWQKGIKRFCELPALSVLTASLPREGQEGLLETSKKYLRPCRRSLLLRRPRPWLRI